MGTLEITGKGVLVENNLTGREREVLLLISKGLNQKTVGEKLGISAETVKKHLMHIYRKLGAHNKIEALYKAGMI